MRKPPTRRHIIRAAPFAIAAAGVSSVVQGLAAQVTPVMGQPSFHLFTAQTLSDRSAALHTKPGNDNLFVPPTLPFSFVLTVEADKYAKDFEWHEDRDHIVEITEGTTVYELGGNPQDARQLKPGEWLARTSTGATTHTLHKGDVLVISRGTPHKRSTETSVTLILISITGSLKQPQPA